MNSTLPIRDTVVDVIAKQPITDIHTHLYDPALGSILLWGVDELVTYHYLVAEVFRARPEMKYDAFWKMTKQQQADLIWDELFVKRSPISEACRGVCTVLTALGLDPNARDLSAARAYFKPMKMRDYIDQVFQLANVGRVYMTNDPFDAREGELWEKGFTRDPRFIGVLRLDSALMNWPAPLERLSAKGYKVEHSLGENTYKEIRRYLNDWIDKLDAKYMAISLPPHFSYPNQDPLTLLMTKAVYPTAKERGIPSAMMIGVKKAANPHLGDAGDSVGKMDIRTLERIAVDFPDVKFLITLLSRENQHELCVAARKFKNIVPFGCWWFMNNPSIIRELTFERLELLGLSFVPQHSDARVLDQLIYKWAHSRRLIAEVLTEKYEDLARAGWKPTREHIQRDVAMLLDGKLIG